MLVYVQVLEMSGFCSPIPFIIVSRYLVIDVTILQVSISMQSSGYLIIGFGIDVSVCLTTIVAIVFMIRIQRFSIILYPDHFAIMIVAITIQASTQRGI